MKYLLAFLLSTVAFFATDAQESVRMKLQTDSLISITADTANLTTSIMWYSGKLPFRVSRDTLTYYSESDLSMTWNLQHPSVDDQVNFLEGIEAVLTTFSANAMKDAQTVQKSIEKVNADILKVTSEKDKAKDKSK